MFFFFVELFTLNSYRFGNNKKFGLSIHRIQQVKLIMSSGNIQNNERKQNREDRISEKCYGKRKFSQVSVIGR